MRPDVRRCGASVRALACALILSSGGMVAPALGAAPVQRTQVPGWFRMMLGDFEVTALWDGSLPFNVHDLLTNISPAQIDVDLARAYLEEPVEFSVNAFLINTGPKLVLIDTGVGALMGPHTGKLVANLRAAGYQPEQVDEIYITHMHGDHIGGLTAGGKAIFPNANVHCAQTEADYWLSEAKMKAAPKDQQEGFRTAVAMFKPYIASKHYQPFRGNVQLLPGIEAVAAAGHTPGHAIYKVTSRGETMIVCGDLMHVAAVQFPDPGVAIKFDTDAAAATAERKQVFAEVAASRSWVAGAHIPFPGLGHLRADGPELPSAAPGGSTGKAPVASGAARPNAAPGALVVSYTFVPASYADRSR